MKKNLLATVLPGLLAASSLAIAAPGDAPAGKDALAVDPHSPDVQEPRNEVKEATPVRKKEIGTSYVDEKTKKKAEASGATKLSDAELAKMSDNEKIYYQLVNDKELTEKLINVALLKKHWDWIEYLIPIYKRIKGHDEILVMYAKGAYYRAKGKHKKAIDEYRGIIAKDPSLSYVRLDLAAMLFEDRQYEAAESQFRKVDSEEVSEQTHEICKQYIAAINKQKSWDFSFGINYERNGNVNNASSVNKLETGNGAWRTDKPVIAHGLRYYFGIDRDWNVKGNHYLNTAFTFNGVKYFKFDIPKDNSNQSKDYDEHYQKVEIGYKYKDVNQWVNFIPYFQNVIVSGEHYNRNYGVYGSWGAWLDNRWQVIASADFGRTEYTEDYKRYNGNTLYLSGTAAYFPSSRTMFSVGMNYMNDFLKDEAEGSIRTGVNASWLREWGSGGFSTRFNVRYSHRRFKGRHFFFGVKRIDNEYGFGVSLWHRKFNLFGITPKFNWQYSKVNSSIPLVYSKKGSRFYVSFEKTF